MLATQDKDGQQNGHGLRVIMVAPGEPTWFGKLYVLSPFSSVNKKNFLFILQPPPPAGVQALEAPGILLGGSSPL